MKFVVGLLLLSGFVQATAAQDKIVVSGASGQLGGSSSRSFSLARLRLRT